MQSSLDQIFQNALHHFWAIVEADTDGRNAILT